MHRETKVPPYLLNLTTMEPMTAQMTDVTFVWMCIAITTALIAIVALQASK